MDGGEREFCKDFEQIFLSYKDRLYHFILRIGHREEDALDVLQDTFLRAYCSVSHFEGRSQIYTWLFRIAANCAFSHLRKQIRRRQLFVEPFKEEEGGSFEIEEQNSLSPYEKLNSEQTQTLVQTALAEIKPEFRAPLILKDIEGMSYEEIGEVLQLSLGTVKSRIFRAREMLRKKLAKQIKEYSS